MSDPGSDKATNGLSDSDTHNLTGRVEKLPTALCDENTKMQAGHDSDVNVNSWDKGKGKDPEDQTMDSAKEPNTPGQDLEALMGNLRVHHADATGAQDGQNSQTQTDPQQPLEWVKRTEDGVADNETNFYVRNETEDGKTTYSLAKHIVLVFEPNGGNECHFKVAPPPHGVEVESPDVWMTIKYRLRGTMYTSYGNIIKNYWRRNGDQRRWAQIRLVKIAQILTRMQRAEHAAKTKAMRDKAKEWAAVITSGKKLSRADKDHSNAIEATLRKFNEQHDGVLEDIFAEVTAARLSQTDNYDADDEEEPDTEAETEIEVELDIKGDGCCNDNDNDNDVDVDNNNQPGPGPSTTPLGGSQLDDPLEMVLKRQRLAARAQASAEIRAQLATLDLDSLGADVSEPDFTPPESAAKPKTKGVFVPAKQGDGHIVREKTRGWVKKQKRGRKA